MFPFGTGIPAQPSQQAAASQPPQPSQQAAASQPPQPSQQAAASQPPQPSQQISGKLFVVYAVKSDGSTIEVTKVSDTGTEVVLGREELAQYAWRDPQTISRKHLTIKVVGGKILLRDDGSVNGTYVDGQNIKGKNEVELPSNKEIVLVNPTSPVLKLVIKEA
ncbi:MAG: FHA domain-containing protein [Thermoprotei archaeon]